MARWILRAKAFGQMGRQTEKIRKAANRILFAPGQPWASTCWAESGTTREGLEKCLHFVQNMQRLLT